MAHYHHHDDIPESRQSDVDSFKDNRTWAEKNKAHWNNVAATYNSTHTQKQFGDLINKITAFLHQNVDWIGVPFSIPSTQFEEKNSSSQHDRSVRVLDYACGPGTVTAALAGYAIEYIGLDISDNMVKEYNERFQTGQTTETNTDMIHAKAYVADLFEPNGPPSSISGPEFFNFNLAAVSGGFHHFENVELATERLVERLKPGGVLLIFDFLTFAPHDLYTHKDPALHTIVHHGFDEARVRQLFGDAGLEDIDIKLMDGTVLLRGKSERQGFLARGRKPAN